MENEPQQLIFESMAPTMTAEEVLVSLMNNWRSDWSAYGIKLWAENTMKILRKEVPMSETVRGEL